MIAGIGIVISLVAILSVSGIAFGNEDNYLSFDGSGKYVSTQNIEINPDGTSFAVSVWTRGAGPLVSPKAGSEEHYFAIHQGLQYAPFHTRNTDGHATDFNAPLPDDFSASKWNNLVFVVQQEGENYVKMLYVNGRLSASQVVDDKKVVGWDGPMNIGKYYIESATFTGDIDDVRIYDAVKTPAQVEALYGGKDDRANLIAYYSFDQGSGTELIDNSGNGHTGTLVNDPIWKTKSLQEKAAIFVDRNLFGLVLGVGITVVVLAVVIKYKK